jgi:O-antigen/teichoic acid export membrane protein
MNLRAAAIRIILRIVGSNEADSVAKLRWRRVLSTATASFAARGLSILTGLISVPLTLHYLGPERYGVLMTITSGIILMAFADLGLGNGVVNAISQADGANDHRQAEEAVSSAFFMLSGVAVLIVAAFLLTPHSAWLALFNIKTALAAADIQPTVAVIVLSFAISLPFGVSQRVQLGFQEGYNNNLWQMGGNVVGLLGLLLAVHFRASLPWLVLSITGAPAFALLCNFVYQFGWARPWLRPRIASFNWSTCHELLRTGLVFCSITIFATIGTASDNIIIAHSCGSVAVAEYSVVQKLFSVLFMIHYITGPLWPAFSEAHARGEVQWIRSAFRRTTVFSTLFSGAACLIFLVFGRDIIRLWVGPTVVPSLCLLSAFVAWRFMANVADTAISFLSMRPLLNTQLVLCGVSAMVAFCGKLVGARYYGINGVAWATALSYIILFTVPAIVVTENWLNRRISQQKTEMDSPLCEDRDVFTPGNLQ